MIPPAMFSSFSATKALAHVLRLPGSNVEIVVNFPTFFVVADSLVPTNIAK
jgi:hypothetical protein